MSKENKSLLSLDTISKIMDKREEDQRKKSITEEEVKDWSAALNRIFSGNDGQLLLKKMIRYSGLLSFDNKIDGAKLIEDQGKKKVVTELIFPYLKKEHIAKAIIE